MDKSTLSERALRDLYAKQLKDTADTAKELSTRGGILFPEKAMLTSLQGDMIQQSHYWDCPDNTTSNDTHSNFEQTTFNFNKQGE
jgi:hypothetical protein